MKHYTPGMMRDTGLFAGGVVHLGGGSSGPSNQTVTQTNIPSWLRAPTERVVTKAETLANRPYQPYVDAQGNPIERIAGVTNDQNASYNAARNLQGTYQPSFNQASQTYANSLGLAGDAYNNYNPNAVNYGAASQFGQQAANNYQSQAGDFAGNRAQTDAAVGSYNPYEANFGGATAAGNAALAGYNPGATDFNSAMNQTNAAVGSYNPGGADFAGSVNRGDAAAYGYNPNIEMFNQGAAERYMNPYLESVIGNAQKAAQQNFAESQAGRNARAAKSGSFGGSRSAIGDEMARREYDSQFQSLTSDLLNKGYSNAQAMFMADRDAKDKAAQYSANLGMQNADLNLRSVSAQDAANRAGANLGLQGAELNLKNLSSQDAASQYLAKLGMENANLGLSAASAQDAANQAATKFGLQGSAQNLQNMSAEDAQNQYAARLGMENAGLIQKGNEAQDAASRFAASLGLDTAGLGLKAGELQQGLGKDAYNLSSQQMELLNKYGTQQQLEQQRRDDLLYKDFREQTDYPMQQQERLMALIRGTPYSSSQTASTNVGANMLGQGLGTAATIAGATGALR
jgi:hypothetical protein